MKISQRENGTKRVQIDCGGVSKTDQSFAKSVNINNIIKKFQKTGILPNTSGQAVYADVSALPSLEEAHRIIKTAESAFLDLPSDVRKLMDNNPLKMEMWLSDEANYDMAVKYGLLEKKSKVTDVVTDDSSNNNTGDIDATTSNEVV